MAVQSIAASSEPRCSTASGMRSKKAAPIRMPAPTAMIMPDVADRAQGQPAAGHGRGERGEGDDDGGHAAASLAWHSGHSPNSSRRCSSTRKPGPARDVADHGPQARRRRCRRCARSPSTRRGGDGRARRPRRRARRWAGRCARRGPARRGRPGSGRSSPGRCPVAWLRASSTRSAAEKCPSRSAMRRARARRGSVIRYALRSRAVRNGSGWTMPGTVAGFAASCRD